ncbi:MAG: Glycosyl transferase group 1 [uncultured Sulfurovum sp.]|uniref:Glycosyl transferase group 1 n=1 Tax=uncultured Sulfurovum sp. TaxID=269237 RepID=A0A6S6THW1_9BACT|nr:MAG: Glycosyl transferase group 1 [uncultured Sulfurovum sp.]
MKKDILIIGSNPNNEKINHPGGQLTAMTNLIEYMETHDISYDVIDMFRSSFPPKSGKEKLLESWDKYKELRMALKTNTYKGGLVFASYGLGFWEKLFFSLTMEKKGIKTLFFIRSGHFMQSVIDKNYIVPFKKYFMNKLSYIGYQGGKWEEFYTKVGIEDKKLIKILNWIKIPQYKIKTFSSTPTFLYVGWMVEKKGVIELIDTILRHKELSKYKFIFVGGGTLVEELTKKVELASARNITFTGWLDSSLVGEFYEEADVLVLPSHAEGFPNAILEALSYQLPIIATDVGGVSESVIDGYNGFLVSPRNEEKLYQAIKNLGNSLDLRREFSKNSQAILEKNHAIDVNCQKIFDLYNISIKNKQ